MKMVVYRFALRVLRQKASAALQRFRRTSHSLRDAPCSDFLSEL
jgi:hypothetical protein